jgi:hypothetical protein
MEQRVRTLLRQAREIHTHVHRPFPLRARVREYSALDRVTISTLHITLIVRSIDLPVCFRLSSYIGNLEFKDMVAPPPGDAINLRPMFLNVCGFGSDPSSGAVPLDMFVS